MICCFIQTGEVRSPDFTITQAGTREWRRGEVVAPGIVAWELTETQAKRWIVLQNEKRSAEKEA